MKLQVPHILKKSILQFADLYHQYKVEAEKLQKAKYSIHSSLKFYKKTKMIQLVYNDRPGDLLPPMTILEIKNTPDILGGLHPIDVNSIDDLYYVSQDKISELVVSVDKIQVRKENGQYIEFDINQKFEHENLASKRISLCIR